MIYAFTDTVNESDYTTIKNFKNIAAFVSASDFEKFYSSFNLDETAYKSFNPDDRYFRSEVLNYDDYCYGTLIIIEPDINNTVENRIAFYMRENLILFIEISDPDHYIYKRFHDTINRITPAKFSAENFFSTFIDCIISSDNKGLEDIEIEINRIEDRIIQENEYKNFYEELLTLKRKLLKLRNYYEQLIDIGEALCEKTNALLDKKNLLYFKSFIRKSERLCSDVNLLRDNIIQLRETYQTSLDMKLNNTMKLFTVITAIFSPLTLIAGWYGMNFRYMPELYWKHGYLCVIILSILTVLFCIYIFKKKKVI